MIFNIPLKRKDAAIDASPCVVDKTVELSADAYAHFCRNLLADYDFIKDNVDTMYQDEDGVSHCLLVLGEGQEDGVLVESEGSSYARYSAVLPCARQLCLPQQQYDPILREFCDKLQSTVDGIVKAAMQNHENGMYRVLYDDYNLSISDAPGSTEFLYEMLRHRPELAAMEEFSDELVLQLSPEYVPKQPEQDLENRSDPALSM